jgi:membrane-associated protein
MFDVTHWVQQYGSTFGYVIVSGIIFAETGLLIGFFLPGDTLLFPAGLLASQGYFNIVLLCALAFVSAVAGNCAGYFFGKHVGKKIFHKEDSLIFHKDHIVRAKNFYDKHGGKTIILARFLPILRTFAPIVAGVSEMNFAIFTLYSAIGALFWAVGVTVAGFYLGQYIPNIDKFIIPIILTVIVLSISSPVYELIRTKERRAKLLAHAHAIIKRKKAN